MYCPASVVVTMYFEGRRGLATGIAVCGAGFGTFLFAPLSTYLIEHYTWRGTLLIYAGIILNCVVCGMLFRPLDFVPVYEDELEAEEEMVQSCRNLYAIEEVVANKTVGIFRNLCMN